MSKPVNVPWSESGGELYARFAAERDVRRRQRLQALWLVRTGAAIGEAARLAGGGQRSLERWLGWYRDGGLEAVLGRVPGHGARGRPNRLTPDQRQALVARAASGAFRTYDEARTWVEQTFGVGYRYKGIHALLTRLGIHPKVPRPQAAKADPAAQAAWKKGGSPRP